MLLKNKMPSENLSDGIFLPKQPYFFIRAAKFYPKQQQSFHRHSRAGGNLERKI
ncbi:hypothetical protein NMH_2043 [Neisseria meningitidis H44/76]|uniref:Uncharacterized protein n=3 Tax=Neisseria meningitidis TaxID=487 RepID=A0A0H5QXB4_NEIMI|nr:hypothetical protein NMH_2043 [Neisseria meningitidis H44/76]CCA45705.1 hypothetical protein NMALPHA522_2164 [Neisseria meningitidis alpha522]CRZ00233.1 FIG00848999: hypothetical protein [Neisseria meningitidis serogroup B]